MRKVKVPTSLLAGHYDKVEFTDYAKKHPGKLNYGTPGMGTSFHFDNVMMARKLGIDTVHVPNYPEKPPYMNYGVIDRNNRLVHYVPIAAYAAAIPGVQLHVVQGAGHLLPMERPAELADLLRKWIQAPGADIH